MFGREIKQKWENLIVVPLKSIFAFHGDLNFFAPKSDDVILFRHCCPKRHLVERSDVKDILIRLSVLICKFFCLVFTDKLAHFAVATHISVTL